MDLDTKFAQARKARGDDVQIIGTYVNYAEPIRYSDAVIFNQHYYDEVWNAWSKSGTHWGNLPRVLRWRREG